MSDEKKDKGESVVGMLFQPCPHVHMHPLGQVEGLLFREGSTPQGEIVYEDKNHSFVGGGNPKHSARYDQMDWN